MTLESQLPTFQTQLNTELKSIIRQYAYDTGNLMEQTFVVIQNNPNSTPSILINTIDYFSYLDKGTSKINPRELLNKFYNTSAFKNITNQIGTLYVQEMIQKELK